MARVNAKKHLHTSTWPPWHYDSAAKVANSAFYSNRVTASRSIATFKQKHPDMLWPNP